MDTATLQAPAIAIWMAEFARALRALPPKDREDIITEIRSHLMLRSEAVGPELALRE